MKPTATLWIILVTVFSANGIEIISYDFNPGLFLEEVKQAHLLEGDMKITTIINNKRILIHLSRFLEDDLRTELETKLNRSFYEILEFFRKRTSDSTYRNFSEVAENYYSIVGEIESFDYTKEYNVTKVLQGDLKLRANNTGFIFDKETQMVYMKNRLDSELPEVFWNKSEFLAAYATITLPNVSDHLLKLKNVLEVAKNHQLVEYFLDREKLREVRNQAFSELGVYIPNFEDNFGQIECPLLKVNLVAILDDFYFEITVPTYKKTLTFYRLHSLPTFYGLNNKIIRNEIIIPSKYIGLDNNQRAIVFLEDINNIQPRRCGKADYLHLTLRVEVAFECASRIMVNRTNKGCPTTNSVSDQPAFSEGHSGIFFSSPRIPVFNFSCNGITGIKSPNNTVGITELPENCYLHVQNRSFIGNSKRSDVYFSKDALGIGDLTEYLANIEEIPDRANHATAIPPNFSPKSQLTPEALEEFRKYLEIVSATASSAIVIIIIALCAFRIINKWDLEARDAIFPSYRDSGEHPDITIGQGQGLRDDLVITWRGNPEESSLIPEPAVEPEDTISPPEQFLV